MVDKMANKTAGVEGLEPPTFGLNSRLYEDFCADTPQPLLANALTN